MTIDISNITNATDGDDGTGVFDTLMNAVQHHITEQYNENRLKGADYAQVYLGALQATLAQSIKALTDVKNTEQGGVIDLQKQKLQEEIDLVIAQTAAVYENVDASREKTKRDNNMNTKQLIKVDKETVLLDSQNSELLLNGPVERDLKTEQKIAVTSGALDNTNKVNADVALTNAQELEVEASTVRNDAMSTKALLKIAEETSKLTSEITLVSSQKLKVDAETTYVSDQDAELLLNGVVDRSLKGAQEAEIIAGTTRKDAESVEKVALITAQTLGFKTDAKQKLLKQMLDGSAVNTTTSGSVFSSPAVASPGIENVANDILDDLGSTVNL